jgi:hypothetical protein
MTIVPNSGVGHICRTGENTRPGQGAVVSFFCQTVIPLALYAATFCLTESSASAGGKRSDAQESGHGPSSDHQNTQVISVAVCSTSPPVRSAFRKMLLVRLPDACPRQVHSRPV